MIDRTIATFGRLDAAFNNAGVVNPLIDTLETTDAEFERLLAVNLRGVWHCLKAELRHMLGQGSGAIVNCSSIGGVAGSAGHSAYAATKHAGTGGSKTAALEDITKEIRINDCC